jgi:nitrous oxidase accessory protein
MKKQLLIVGIVFLFVGMGFTSISGIQINNQIIQSSGRGNTLYVGGSGPGNYTTIQSAINDANSGDTVFVFDDSSPYYEHVIIDKSIDLIGENKDSTIIDGGGYGNVILIQEYCDGVIISGFTIQKCGRDQYPINYAGIYISSNSNNIHDNNIINNDDTGIIVLFEKDYNYDNIISGNSIKNNYIGIVICDSIDYEIFDNNISNNFIGAHFTPYSIPINVVSCSYDISGKIYRNNFNKNSIGIHQSFWGGDAIYENNITNNNNGIYLDVMYDYGGYNNIYNNTIIGNGEGIGGSSNNNIFQNNFISNLGGIEIRFQVGGGDDNKIYQNNFIGNLFYNARSLSDNQWDNDIVGNYWDDYKGFDLNGDGIGDIPYRVRPFFRGGKDRYPLMEPLGDIPEYTITQVNKALNFNILNMFLERFPLLQQLLDIGWWNLE